MTASHVIATGLLVLGVVIEILAVVGVTAMRDVYDRLHYVGLAGFGALLVGASVLVREGFSLIGNKALFAGAFLALFGPVLVHATARSMRIGNKALFAGAFLALFGPVLVHATARSMRTRQRGDWRDGVEQHREDEPS